MICCLRSPGCFAQGKFPLLTAEEGELSITRLEGDIVVGNGARGCRRWGTGASGACGVGYSGTALTASRVFPASEKNHIACADFGGFSLIAVLVVPFASLQAAFDVNQAAFG